MTLIDYWPMKCIREHCLKRAWRTIRDDLRGSINFWREKTIRRSLVPLSMIHPLDQISINMATDTLLIDCLLDTEFQDYINFDTTSTVNDFDFEDPRFQTQPANEEPLAEDQLMKELSPDLARASCPTNGVTVLSAEQPSEPFVEAYLANATDTGGEVASDPKLVTEEESQIQV
jgi:hypothetical protein